MSALTRGGAYTLSRGVGAPQQGRPARIKSIVDGWPPLTQAQLDQVGLLLRPAPAVDTTTAVA